MVRPCLKNKNKNKKGLDVWALAKQVQALSSSPSTAQTKILEAHMCSIQSCSKGSHLAYAQSQRLRDFHCGMVNRCKAISFQKPWQTPNPQVLNPLYKTV
jgi:hypothetical protein